jgi:hypothetical protein
MSKEGDDHSGGLSWARVGRTGRGLGPASENSKENELSCQNPMGRNK